MIYNEYMEYRLLENWVKIKRRNTIPIMYATLKQ